MWASRNRRAALAVGIVLFAVSLLGVLTTTTPVSAAGETVVSTPSSALIDGGTVSVDVTTSSATDASVFIAVTQCGNADSSGAPLAATAAGDCAGAEGFGTSLRLVGFPAGAVPAGKSTTPLTLKQTGIGSNGAKCISVPPATLPCVIQAATANDSGCVHGARLSLQRDDAHHLRVGGHHHDIDDDDHDHHHYDVHHDDHDDARVDHHDGARHDHHDEGAGNQDLYV